MYKPLQKILGTFAFATIIFSFSQVPVHSQGISLSITPSSTTVSQATTIALSYTSSSSIGAGSKFQLDMNSGYTGTPAFSVNGTAVTATSTTSGTTKSYSFTPGTSIAAGNVTVQVTGLTTPVTAGNYEFDLGVANKFYGAVLQYVGQANQTEVRGFVPTTLSLALSTNVCDLGTLTTTTVASCNYRIITNTNASSGYNLYMKTSGDFSNGTCALPNSSAGTNGTGGTAITAGTPRFGAIVSKGATTSGSTTSLASQYNGGSNPVAINNTTSTLMMSSTGPNNPAVSDTTNTSQVTNYAAISGNTCAGNYTQTQEITSVANF